MAVPKEILEVPRPKNTVILVYGKNKDRYAVRKRIGCRNDNGRHLPTNGPIIGHIINGKYVPTDDIPSVEFSPVDEKEWANVVLSDNLFHDIFDELREVYNYSDAIKIYCITILRVCHPGIKDYELQAAYEQSFLSELYPDVALSKNTVSTFLHNVGRATSRIIQFMQNRSKTINLDHHLIIDGTLKTDDSKINSLSNFSRKAKLKGSRDISILYAFDLEKKEPVCSKCFPGNMLDKTAYEEFISENKIEQGIIIGDKAFPESVAHEYFVTHPNVHYLNPIYRSSVLAKRYNMLQFTEPVKGVEDVTGRKEKCAAGNKWLYSFKNIFTAATEEHNWLKTAKKKNDYDVEVLEKKKETFGTIILESDLDMPLETAYQIYANRWEIEIVMRFYKSACEFDNTREHDNYSVMASEFCDFLATVLTFRLLNEFDRTKLLETYTYKKIMGFLFGARKLRQPQKDWELKKVTKSILEVLQKLNLVPTPESVPKKRGRPKKY